MCRLVDCILERTCIAQYMEMNADRKFLLKSPIRLPAVGDACCNVHPEPGRKNLYNVMNPARSRQSVC